MNYLLDTQVFLWSIININNLPKTICSLLNDFNNQIFVSSVSIWEISIKFSIGKLHLPFLLEDLPNLINNMNFINLNIENNHLVNVASLPFHHKDPFDRLIISQGLIEDLLIITSDKNFKLYDIKILEI